MRDVMACYYRKNGALNVRVNLTKHYGWMYMSMDMPFFSLIVNDLRLHLAVLM